MANQSSTDMRGKSAGFASVMALFTVVLWASAFPAIHIALRSFEPIPLAALRFAIAGVAWACWLALARQKLPAIGQFFRIGLCAGIGIALYNILLNTGQRTVSAGAASFIVNVVPVFTALFAAVVLHEKFGMRAWLGTLISFGGVALIAMNQPGGLAFGAGATLVLGAAISQATFFTLQRPLIAIHGARLCAALVIICGAVALSPWLPRALEQARAAAPPDLAAVVYLGLGPAALGYASWALAQSHFGAARAANFLYLAPPIAMLLSVALTGERPAVVELAGGALAILGVVIVNTRKT